MNERKHFLLVSIREDALMGYWSFHADNELAVARCLLRDPWQYQDVFWALRVSLSEAERLGPEELLAAIHGSYPNARVRAVLYLLPVVQPADCSDVTSTRPTSPQAAQA